MGKSKRDFLEKPSPAVDLTKQRAWASGTTESVLLGKVLCALTVQAPKNLYSEWFDKDLMKKLENYEGFILKNAN
ncbi:hypothetical protein [Microbulbifer sp. ZKSA002]|uniref:hypothetical protein n=1 Tax=Microbulbifer sp. ZKSA002 TaxID=3243388 RepID=UPI00403982F1